MKKGKSDKESKSKSSTLELIGRVLAGIEEIGEGVKVNVSKLHDLEVESLALSKKLAAQDERFSHLDKTLEMLCERKPVDGINRVRKIDAGLISDAKVGFIEIKIKSLEEETRKIWAELNTLGQRTELITEPEETLSRIDNRIVQLKETLTA